jgi:SOS-response transcriptional repressor LexA
MAAQKTNSKEWAERIRKLLADLKLSQAGLAERLGVSPPTVSRWVLGRQEPTAESYVALGNLARPPNGVYFWERAGIDASSLLDASFHQAVSSLRIGLHDLQLIAGRTFSRQVTENANAVAVAVPLLNVTAFGDRIPPQENISLSEAGIEEILLAPLSWCPHPESMIGIHFVGESMLPAIAPGSILFVDTAARDREHLRQRITVVSHRDLGFKVARLERIGAADLLISANYKYAPVDVSNASKWKIFGEVLWWVSREGEAHP